MSIPVILEGHLDDEGMACKPAPEELDPTAPVLLVNDAPTAERQRGAGFRAFAPPMPDGWTAVPDAALERWAAKLAGALDRPRPQVVLAVTANQATHLGGYLVAVGLRPYAVAPEAVAGDMPDLAGAAPVGWTPLASAGERVGELLERVAHGQLPALSTGIETLDSFLGDGGWRTGLFLLGGQPGVGKTAFALSQAVRAALAGQPVLYVSADQGVDDLFARMLCAEARLPAAAWFGLQPGDPALADLAAAAGRLPLDRLFFVDDLGEAGASAIAKLVGDIEGQTGQLPLVVVDYLQQLRPAKAEQAAEERTRIAAAGDALRRLVRSAPVILLALSSVNRASYHLEPGLDSLKGSGDLEFNADAVLLIRDTEDDDEPVVRALGEPWPPEPVELHVLKNRFGRRTADRPILVDFDTTFGTFTDRGLAPPPERRKKLSNSASKSASNVTLSMLPGYAPKPAAGPRWPRSEKRWRLLRIGRPKMPSNPQSKRARW